MKKNVNNVWKNFALVFMNNNQIKLIKIRQKIWQVEHNSFWKFLYICLQKIEANYRLETMLYTSVTQYGEIKHVLCMIYSTLK